jgi:phosphoribosylformimino-5-aminoimidazole carboxamide ribotide isomerase
MAFEIIPAIDLLGGKVVRLEQGRRDRVTVYSDAPVSVAQGWEEAGARRLHVVDLDGAFDGLPRNLDAVRAICQAVEMEVELGGGLRRAEHLQAALDAGVQRVVLGTRAFEDENFLRAQVEILGPSLIVGVDARNGKVSLRGWVEDTETRAGEFVRRLEAMGVSEVIFTDIATDGMMSGPNLRSLVEVAESAPGMDFIASGGISSLDDLLALSRLQLPNLIGAITGKALYSGAIELGTAVRRLAAEAGR